MTCPAAAYKMKLKDQLPDNAAEIDAYFEAPKSAEAAARLIAAERPIPELQQRLAKLAGGVAVIHVGGATEIEVKEKKDRVEDAMHATRAAVEEGILPGGGVALLYAGKVLAKLEPANEDQRVGIDIVRRALQAPVRKIVDNAALDSAVVVGKLLDGDDLNWGFDAQTETYCDMVKAGIIDPTKVVRTALQDAASIASLLITTEAMVADLPEKKPMEPMPGAEAMAY